MFKKLLKFLGFETKKPKSIPAKKTVKPATKRPTVKKATTRPSKTK